MRVFLKRLFLFFSILALSCAALFSLVLFVIGDQYGQTYTGAIPDKIHRLESIDDPKIILVGHSGLAFGMDSEQLEVALGMPVVNLGYHGAMGNAFHENIAKKNINEGDIVVVCHSTFANDALGDGFLGLSTFGNCPEIIDSFQAKDYICMLRAYPEYIKKNLYLWAFRMGNQTSDGCYSRRAFNEYGDVILKPESGQVDGDVFFSENTVYLPEIDDVCINRLNQYNQYVMDQGATLVVAGYPVAYGKYSTFDKEDFRIFRENLQEALNCEVISDYTDYFFPYEYFYDTVLHLNREGVEVRTAQLITDLKEWDSERFSS